MSTVKKSKVEKVFNAYIDDIYRVNNEIERSRLGKILTVVDGAIADETQRKAVKDLVHDAWYSATAYRTYPQPTHVAEALGIDLKRDIPVAVTSPDEYNPYKEVIKDQ